MTPRERQVLDFVERFYCEHKYSPSYQEIADAMDMRSKGGIKNILSALARDGFIVWSPSSRRGIIPKVAIVEDRAQHGANAIGDMVDAHEQGTISLEDFIANLQQISAYLAGTEGEKP